MKKALYFHLPACPHCKKANEIIAEVKKNPKYAAVELTSIDEQKNADFAANFNYNFVPTFFVDGKKFFEAAPGKAFTENDCKALFDLILS